MDKNNRNACTCLLTKYIQKETLFYILWQKREMDGWTDRWIQNACIKSVG